MALSLALHKATWLRIFITKQRLLLLYQQFIKIHVHESSKCADVILLTIKQYELKDRKDQLFIKEIALQFKST